MSGCSEFKYKKFVPQNFCQRSVFLTSAQSNTSNQRTSFVCLQVASRPEICTKQSLTYIAVLKKKKKEFTDVGSSDEEESRNENREERQKHLQTCENTTDVINKSVVVVVASKFH